jgi:hypothetical protein
MQQVFNCNTFLFHGVAVANGHRPLERSIIFPESFKVHGYAERSTHFILTTVTAAPVSS